MVPINFLVAHILYDSAGILHKLIELSPKLITLVWFLKLSYKIMPAFVSLQETLKKVLPKTSHTDTKGPVQAFIICRLK